MNNKKRVAHPASLRPTARVRPFASSLALLFLLSACGGGGGDNSTTTARLTSPVLPLGDGKDLCEGLITDKVNRPMTALAKPAVGQAVTDPQFGTTIRRITNVGGTGVIKPAYSTVPAWNADETYLILYHTSTTNPGHHLYNGKTYQHIRQLNIDPPDLEQFYWHATDPDVLYYIDANTKTLTRYRVSTNTTQPVRTFTCNAGLVDGGNDPMYMSWDSDLIGLTCEDGSVFSYRISTNSLGSSITVANASLTAPVAAPSGTQMFFNLNNRADVRQVSDISYIRSITGMDADEHGSVHMLADGSDAFTAVQFGTYEGTVVVGNMSTGNARVVVGPDTGYPFPPSGTHISGVALKRPGWVAVSIIGDADGQSLLDNELLLVDTNPGGQVCRVGHHRSRGDLGPQGYWAEPHVVISPSGTRMVFASDWGGATVDTYVVELPSYQP
jgi:hypothetical protein